MKLPSSPLIVYLTTYSILFFQSIIIHFLLVSFISSPLCRVYLIDFTVTCTSFFIGNYIYSSNNIYDLHWPLVPLICSIYFHITLNSLKFFSLKCLPLFILIFLWSFHLIYQAISLSNNIHHEDWRYQMMRKQYKNNFLIFSFFALHLLPMFQVLLGSSSIYYIYTNSHVYESLTIVDIVLLLIIFSGVLLENIADKQLKEFRCHKQKTREHKFAVLSNGLWKYSRHPNYLGEIIFWWSLFFLGYIYNAPLWCAIGPLLITLMMIFGSIPMTEERLFRKYPEYKFVQQRTPMLIPTFGFLE
jgi:steroid 5-alpha reductase family enzyme